MNIKVVDMGNLIVCCVKWGTKYDSEYVVRLFNMVRRNLSYEHEFVCLTDAPSGLPDDIKTRQLPDADTLKGWWNKISLFRGDIFDKGTTVIYLDLDIVIVNSIDFLLDDPGGFYIAKDWKRKRKCWNSSVMRFQAGEYQFVYDRFWAIREHFETSKFFEGDQDWIYDCIDVAKLWSHSKIVSYKMSLASRSFPILRKLKISGKFLPAPKIMKTRLPEQAAIVVFHGKPDPEDVMDGPYGIWKHAPFIRNHWL